MVEKNLGYNVRVKAEKVDYKVFRDQLEVVKKVSTLTSTRTGKRP